MQANSEVNSFFITIEHCKTLLENRAAIILDARFQLSNPNWGEERYHISHLPFAQYVHLDRDGSGQKGEHGGRHPLPTKEQWLQTVQQLGVRNDDIIVIYDAGDHAFAARFLWLFKWIGHERVYILNGGFSKWQSVGGEVTSVVEKRNPSHYEEKQSHVTLKTIEDVKKIALNGEKGLLIDSREERRYNGEVEPIDRIAGHIPTAVNVPWVNIVTEEGSVKDKEQLKKLYEPFQNESCVVYCGSGVTGCLNVVGLLESGHQHVSLYSGSYSDWVSYHELPVSKKV